MNTLSCCCCCIERNKECLCFFLLVMDVSESPPPPYCELPSLEDVSVASLSVTENDGEPTEMEIEAAASFVPPMVAAAAASSVKTEFTDDDLPEAAVKGNSKELSAEEEEEARWTVAKIFFQTRSLVEHQLRSFNEFLEDGLQEMVNDAPPFEVSPDHNPAAIRIEGLPRQARISYGNVSVGKPTCSATEDKKDVVDLYPREARLRNLTYSAPINLDMNLKVYVLKSSSKRQGKEEVVLQDIHENVCIGRMPIMVKSRFCHLHDLTDAVSASKGDCAFDIGGYFIIKGSEKVLIAQEERINQKIQVGFSQKTNTWMAICAPPFKGFLDYRSKPTVKLVRATKIGPPLLNVSVAKVLEPLPIVIVMRAFGVCSDKDLMQRVSYIEDDTQLMELVRHSILEADACMVKFLSKQAVVTGSATELVRNQKQALAYIGANVRDNVEPLESAGRKVLEYFLSHIGGGYTRKAFFLGYMVNQVLLAFLGRRPEDEKDHYMNKRLDLAGQLLQHQMRKVMFHFQHDTQKRVQKHLGKEEVLGPIKSLINDSIVTKGLQGAFTLGNWNTGAGLKNSGVVGDLKRINPMATISQMRQTRVNLPPRSRPSDAARHPNFSYWGRICPIQTTDGTECGLVKHLSLTGIVSSDMPTDMVMCVLSEHSMENLEETNPASLQYKDKVFVNGTWVGVMIDPEKAVNELREIRRSHHLHSEVEVVRDPVRREVFIYTDGGRILRPLLLVQNQQLVLSRQHLKKLKVMMRLHGAGACWTYLLKEGVVELLGIEEEEKVMVATNGQDLEKAREYAHAPVYTHSEIDSSFLLGLGAVMIPFLQHNQALRNLHQSEKHCRQAIGYYCTNLWSRADSSAHHLFYPQKPIVTTRAADCLQKPELMNGQVAIVAIQSFAYNQEDSIVMNQASIDRGLFRSAHYKIHRGEERKNVDEHFSKPSTSDHKGWTHAWSGLDYKACLDKVDDDGFPCVGENLTKGNIVIGKLTAEQGRPKLSNTSTHLKLHQKGHVDQVLLANEEDGHRISKVRLRFTRAPQAGDKFSSLHGQKGVIGAVFPQEDLPYTRQGIVPDIIINPHALPSRQTFGQIMECLLGKVVATSGKPCFATRAETPQRVNELLFQYHYGRGGAEYMCNGTTGMPLEALITMGPTFYQRLDHMVEDKIKFRGIGGSINPLTHQPVRDRNSLGGVKFGEMERDCMLGHGASSTLRERYFLLSDPYKMNICAACRRPATMDASRTPKCHFCKNGKHIVQIQIPYACKLLWQELLSMGISVYMDTKLC